MIDIWIPGVPVPQGSMRTGGHGRMFHANSSGLHAWRYEVNWRSRAAMKRAKCAVAEHDPVTLSTYFVLRRPVATPKTRATPPAVRKPDLDKLARAIGDALTGVVYHDDSQIVEMHCYKRIADKGEDCGVRIVCAVNDCEVFY